MFNYFNHHVYYVIINNFIYYVSINNFLEKHVYNNMLFMSLSYFWHVIENLEVEPGKCVMPLVNSVSRMFFDITSI